ncbi:hypothetical protein DFQ26_003661 [Actinomortierella ambigua]|nr:hypothetical protein DFQ26_003661 [Actinomortierella ambigua]
MDEGSPSKEKALPEPRVQFNDTATSPRPTRPRRPPTPRPVVPVKRTYENDEECDDELASPSTQPPTASRPRLSTPGPEESPCEDDGVSHQDDDLQRTSVSSTQPSTPAAPPSTPSDEVSSTIIAATVQSPMRPTTSSSLSSSSPSSSVETSSPLLDPLPELNRVSSNAPAATAVGSGTSRIPRIAWRSQSSLQQPASMSQLSRPYPLVDQPRPHHAQLAPSVPSSLLSSSSLSSPLLSRQTPDLHSLRQTLVARLAERSCSTEAQDHQEQQHPHLHHHRHHHHHHDHALQPMEGVVEIEQARNRSQSAHDTGAEATSAATQSLGIVSADDLGFQSVWPWELHRRLQNDKTYHHQPKEPLTTPISTTANERDGGNNKDTQSSPSSCTDSGPPSVPQSDLQQQGGSLVSRDADLSTSMSDTHLEQPVVEQISSQDVGTPLKTTTSSSSDGVQMTEQQQHLAGRNNAGFMEAGVEPQPVGSHLPDPENGSSNDGNSNVSAPPDERSQEARYDPEQRLGDGHGATTPPTQESLTQQPFGPVGADQEPSVPGTLMPLQSVVASPTDNYRRPAEALHSLRRRVAVMQARAQSNRVLDPQPQNHAEDVNEHPDQSVSTDMANECHMDEQDG